MPESVPEKDPDSEEHDRIRVVFSIGALHGGGSERQIVSLLQHIDRTRFAPHLYLIYRHGPLLKHVPDDIPIAVFEERCQKAPFYVPGLMHRRRVLDMAHYLRECRADISYDRTFLMTLIAADAAQRAGVPSVSTIVTDPTLGFAPVAGRFQNIKRRRLTRLYRSSAQVLAVSKGAARSAEQFYRLPQDSVHTIYNGFDFARIDSESQQSIVDAWWNESKGTRPVIRLVAAGRLNREKGFHLLIEAVGKLKHADPQFALKLAILGDDPTGRKTLQDQIRESSLEDEVHLPGFRTDALAWYRSADVFVLPSLLEGMPNVLLEAMACGTPVVAANCPSGPAEILENGRYGALFPVNDAAALARTLHDFIESRDVAVKTAIQAGNYVRSQFSVNNSVRQLENVLATVCSAERQ